METTETKVITVKKVFVNKTEAGKAWEKLVTDAGNISVFDPHLIGRLKEGTTATVNVAKKGEYTHLVSVAGSAEVHAPETAKAHAAAPAAAVSNREVAIANALRHLADLFEGKA